MSSPLSEPSANHSRSSAEARHTALFTGMVLQQANMALMFLGKTPRPDTDRTTVDLEAASQFIDTLEMFDAKTRGNLTTDEAGLLQETLMTLRITFVEVVERAPAPSPQPRPPAPSADSAAPANPPPPAEGDRPAAAEDRKKFVKHY